MSATPRPTVPAAPCPSGPKNDSSVRTNIGMDRRACVSLSQPRRFADLMNMTWLLMVSGVIGAWTMLGMLCAERRRRVQDVDFAAAARRQALARDAERRAARARKSQATPGEPA